MPSIALFHRSSRLASDRIVGWCPAKINMCEYEYTVMATDFAGHNYEHTYFRSAPAGMFDEPLVHARVMPFVDKATEMTS